jgi:glycosyltransferase involved in cell wall biosynthesis
MSLSLVERVRRLALPAVGVVIDDWMLYGPQVDAWIRLARRLGPLAPLAGGLAGVPARLDFSRIAWVFCSEYTRGRALASQPRLDLTEVAHPGVDTDLFRPAPERSWGWRLLYVGRIDERKGIRTAVEALPRLPGEARLAVVGSGDERFLAELHELGEQLGVADRVDFARRPRNELPAAYAAADVLLFPVRWGEPWGLVPLEAMAVGTPVVATGTGGSGEYLRDGENALVVGHEAGPEEFAAAVRRLATEPALRARLRERGLETAAGFTERAYNDRIEAALVSAAQGG